MALLSWIQDAITNASSQFGSGKISSSYLSTVAQLESGGNPLAQTGSASGLFQFMPSTASQYGVANPFDVQQAANGAAQLAVSNYNFLSKSLGTAPTDFQLYLAHQQGAGGAFSLLTADPNAQATSIIPNTSSITGNLGKDFSGNPATATVSDFLNYWQGKWTAAGGQGATGATATGAPSASASNGTSSGWSDWASHWIVRFFIFGLGLVFVAAALFMFGRGGKTILENATGNVANAVISPPKSRTEFIPAKEVSPPKVKFPSDDPGKGLGPLGKGKNPFMPRAPRRSHKELAEEHLAKAASHIVNDKKKTAKENAPKEPKPKKPKPKAIG